MIGRDRNEKLIQKTAANNTNSTLNSKSANLKKGIKMGKKKESNAIWQKHEIYFREEGRN